MPSGNTSLCLKRHARGIASRHMLKLFLYSSLGTDRRQSTASGRRTVSRASESVITDEIRYGILKDAGDSACGITFRGENR